ncbi:MAG: hypothetical protein HZC28_08835 [Spirochaetes bacterium]|nr:hypothetical protein [Spirochaetota bacterium]
MLIRLCIVSVLASLMAFGNILPDGGFEKPPAEGWTVNDGGISAELTRDTAVFRSGSSSGKLYAAPDSKRSWPAFEREYEAAPSQLFTVTAYIRVENTKSFAYVAMEYLNDLGKRISHDQSGGVSGASTDWTRISIKGVTPDGTVKMRLRLILMDAGTAWFDDVTLTQNKNYTATPKISMDTVHIRNTGEVITKDFSGFGAETDPWLFNKENRSKGVVDADGEIIFSRMKEMGMGLARIFIPWSMWNPSVDGETCDWESDGMLSLYRILDMHQKLGTRVIICSVEWGAKSPLDLPADKHGSGVAKLLDYLVNKKGYTCINYYMVYNEPEITFKKRGYTFDKYVELYRAVHDALKSAKLRDRIKLAVADESSDLSWFTKTVIALNDIADVYSTHSYKRKNDAAMFVDHAADRWAAVKKYDPNWKDKRIYLTEFGVSDKDTTDRNNKFMRTFENGLYIGGVCIDSLNNGINGFSIWCLHRVNYPGFNFMDFGLWEFKDENWKLRPVYFSYSLFTKYCPRGAAILRATSDEPDGLIRTVAASSGKTTTIFVINTAFNDQRVSIEPGVAAKKYSRARYDKSITADSVQWSGITQGAVSASTFSDTVPKQSITVFRFEE